MNNKSRENKARVSLHQHEHLVKKEFKGPFLMRAGLSKELIVDYLSLDQLCQFADEVDAEHQMAHSNGQM